MSKRAFIYCAGYYSDEDISLYRRIRINKDDLIICADGGYDEIATMGIVPDIVIGDMDSLRSEIPQSIPTKRYPRNKDKTDLRLSIDYALEEECDEIILLGAFGNRIDHSIGSLIEMRYILEKGASTMMLSRHSRVYVIDNEITVKKEDFRTLSLIPLTDTVDGVTTSGLRYSLSNYTLKQIDNLGISNEFISDIATVKIEKGLLFVICEE